MSLRRTIVVAACFLLGTPLIAGKLESAIELEWRGAWVVVGPEVRSNCDAGYTNNRVNGSFAEGGGRVSFPPGELAQIVNLNVLRSRVDLKLQIAEPLRFEWQDGPFTLYDQRDCRVELEVEIPRALIKSRDLTAIDRLIAQVASRYATREEATAAKAWNGRQFEPYPDDYESTLVAWEIWKTEQYNAKLETRLEASRNALAELAASVEPGDTYVAGLASGLAVVRGRTFPGCSRLIEINFAAARGETPELFAGDSDKAGLWQRGYREGQALGWHLAVLRVGPGCRRAVPQPLMPTPAGERLDDANLRPDPAEAAQREFETER